MSSLALKLIALVTMTIDHFGAVLTFVPEFRDIAVYMRMIGRIAFPIYVFLIAVGMLKTRKREMYLLRLLVFAFVSFVPYSLFYNVVSHGLSAQPTYFNFDHTNVFITLFLGAASIYAFDWIKDQVGKRLDGKGRGIPGYLLGLAAPVACALLADYMKTDYGSAGVEAIFVTYLVMSIKDNLFLRTVPVFVWTYLQYYKSGGANYYFGFAVIAPLLILLYDGTPGPQRARGRFKMAFYMYYPIHIMAAFLLSVALR